MRLVLLVEAPEQGAVVRGQPRAPLPCVEVDGDRAPGELEANLAAGRAVTIEGSDPSKLDMLLGGLHGWDVAIEVVDLGRGFGVLVRSHPPPRCQHAFRQGSLILERRGGHMWAANKDGNGAAMIFSEAIYPHRHDYHELARRLLRMEARSFTEIVAVRSMGGRSLNGDPYDRTTIGGARCTLAPHGNPLNPSLVQRCVYAPTIHDRRIVRVILGAWLRDISDRYLDYESVVRLENRIAATEEAQLPPEMRRPGIIRTREEAQAAIDRNAPEGCVKFVYNEILRSSLPLYGNNISVDMTFNEYYSALLVWDDFHLTGLPVYINRQEGRVAGDGGNVNFVLAAASDWIRRAQAQTGGLYWTILRG